MTREARACHLAGPAGRSAPACAARRRDRFVTWRGRGPVPAAAVVPAAAGPAGRVAVTCYVGRYGPSPALVVGPIRCPGRT